MQARVTCNNCHSTYDASSLRQGDRFNCTNCGALVVYRPAVPMPAPTTPSQPPRYNAHSRSGYQATQLSGRHGYLMHQPGNQPNFQQGPLYNFFPASSRPRTRSVGLGVALLILTFGLYGYYWTWRALKETPRTKHSNKIAPLFAINGIGSALLGIALSIGFVFYFASEANEPEYVQYESPMSAYDKHVVSHSVGVGGDDSATEDPFIGGGGGGKIHEFTWEEDHYHSDDYHHESKDPFESLLGDLTGVYFITGMILVFFYSWIWGVVGACVVQNRMSRYSKAVSGKDLSGSSVLLIISVVLTIFCGSALPPLFGILCIIWYANIQSEMNLLAERNPDFPNMNNTAGTPQYSYGPSM